MSQTNQELSCSKIWPEGAKIKAGDAASSPSMALKTEESQVYFIKNRTASDSAVSYGINPRKPETHSCHTAAAPLEKLLKSECRVGDSRSFSAYATISETARELCKAVSVSLGLTVESSDVEPALPPCASNDHMSGQGFFGTNCSGAQTPTAVPDYRCPDRHGQKQTGKMFKSSEPAEPFHHIMSAQNFALCDADDITLNETDHLDAGRAASCPYAPTTGAPNLAHFCHAAAEKPCGAYDPPDDGHGAAEDKCAGYQPEQYSVKVKSEGGEGAGALWDGNYTFNKKYNTQFWGSKQNTRDTGPNPAFICNPYEGSVVRPEQWYPGGMPRTPYPNSTCMKTEVGDWLEVAYNDTRQVQ